jgi:hypothetical protein
VVTLVTPPLLLPSSSTDPTGGGAAVDKAVSQRLCEEGAVAALAAFLDPGRSQRPQDGTGDEVLLASALHAHYHLALSGTT